MRKKEKKRLLICLTAFVMILVPGMSRAILAVEQPGQDETAGLEETQKKKNTEKKTGIDQDEEMVTATLTRKDTFEIPNPVSVVNQREILEKAPNNAAELFTGLPGVDVNGVGVNQGRPVIRGFTGQRLLLMEDGIRLNNFHRERDFGEISALVDISQVEQVEIVRGPASVLYGSDAVGGVVNIITKFPEYNLDGTEIHGSFGYRYSTADRQNKGMVNLNGHLGKLVFSLSGNYRSAKDYQAPAGKFGDIELDEDVVVHDTGVKDGGFSLILNYNFSTHRFLTFKYQYYHAEDAGFGFVEPDPYDSEYTPVRTGYPLQEIQRYTLKYRDNDLGLFLADNLSVTAYYTANQRERTLDSFIPFGIYDLPAAGIELRTESFTDIATLGVRLEVNKKIKNHLFTYGIDLFLENTDNTDSTISQVVGFGTPAPLTDTTPLVPNATYRGMGVFLQDDVSLFSRISLVAGVRWQGFIARTKDTPGLEGEPMSEDRSWAWVSAGSLIYRVTDDLKLVLSAGWGFSSPNLIELFYHGITPEGTGFQTRNPGLVPEFNLNFDIGFKYRWKNIYLESFYFNNTLDEGIRAEPTHGTVIGLPAYQFRNGDKLLMYGFEISGKYYFDFGLTFAANYSRFTLENVTDPQDTYQDSYYDKFNFTIHYRHPKKNFWFGYNLRISSYQKYLPSEDNPLTRFFPAFSVHDLSGGITLFKNSSFPMRLGIIVGNITNRLYSEFYNAQLFRPASKRHLVFTWSIFF